MRRIVVIHTFLFALCTIFQEIRPEIVEREREGYIEKLSTSHVRVDEIGHIRGGFEFNLLTPRNS